MYQLASGCTLRPALKNVLLALAWHADPNGRNAFPSVNTIAQRTGYRRRTVQKALRELEAQEIIYAVGSRLGGRRHSTRYDFNVRKLQELKEAANCIHPLGRHKSEPADHERATVVLTNGELRSPEHQEDEKEKKATPVISSQDGKAHKRTEQPRTANRIPDGLDQNRGEEVWSAIREQLKPRVDPHSFDNWLNPLKAAGCADGVLWLRVPIPEFKEMAEKYTNQINEAMTSTEIHDIREVRFAW